MTQILAFAPFGEQHRHSRGTVSAHGYPAAQDGVVHLRHIHGPYAIQDRRIVPFRYRFRHIVGHVSGSDHYGVRAAASIPKHLCQSHRRSRILPPHDYGQDAGIWVYRLDERDLHLYGMLEGMRPRDIGYRIAERIRQLPIHAAGSQRRQVIVRAHGNGVYGPVMVRTYDHVHAVLPVLGQCLIGAGGRHA